jgi:hypothetical protein
LAGIADSFGEQTETLGRRFTGTNSGLHALGQELIYGLYALYFLFPVYRKSLPPWHYRNAMTEYYSIK